MNFRLDVYLQETHAFYLFQGFLETNFIKQPSRSLLRVAQCYTMSLDKDKVNSDDNSVAVNAVSNSKNDSTVSV